MERGQWNHQIVIYGRPGCGKSTLARKLALQLSREGPAYLLAHDPKWTLEGARRFGSMADFQTAVQTNPNGILCVPCSDGDEAAKIAKELGEKSLATTKTKHPVVLLLDEGVAVGGLDPYRLKPNMRDLFAMRRHYHVAPIVTAQSAAFVHYSVNQLATKVIVFQTVARRDLDALERMGFPDKDLARISTLPKYAYATLEIETNTVTYSSPNLAPAQQKLKLDRY